MVKATLITGVAGTTGSQILDYLLDESEEIKSGKRVIIGVDNYFRGTEDNIKHHFNSSYFAFYKGDWRDSLRVLESLSHLNIDEIYHMAAVVPTHYFYDSPDLTYKENCQGTIELFNWAISHGVKRFIVGSSSEIYGHIRDEDLPAKETAMSHFDSVESSTRWSYAEGKLLTEHYLNHFKDKVDRVCHLRFANTYGVRDLDDNHVLPYLINRVVRDEDVHVNKDYEHFYRTFLNNHDSARACVELMNKGKNGVAYNVGSSEEVSIKELLDLVVGVYENLSGKKYSGKILKDIDRPGDPKRRVLCTDRLYEDTGFRPTVMLREGIEEMVNEVLTEVHCGKNS